MQDETFATRKTLADQNSQHDKICKDARARAEEWLKNGEASQYLESLNHLNVEAIYRFLYPPNDYGLDHEREKWDSLLKHLIVDTYGFHIADPDRFYRDARNQILELTLGGLARHRFPNLYSSLTLKSVHFFRQHPMETAWILALLLRHAEITQSTLENAFRDGCVQLRRGQKEKHDRKLMESWTCHTTGPLDSYGDIELKEIIPISRIFSITSGQNEGEYIVSQVNLREWSWAIPHRRPTSTEPQVPLQPKSLNKLKSLFKR